MSVPVAILAAHGEVSGTVPCRRCGPNGETVGVGYDELLDCTLIRHSTRHPVDDDEARDLAEWVDSEIRRHVVLADYGEPLPLHVLEVTS